MENINESEEDFDTCDVEEINRIFSKCSLIAEKSTANNNYILNISATEESCPNVAVNLSESCEVYNLSNNQFAKLVVLDEQDKNSVINDIKFSVENVNLLYTCSTNGQIKQWDIRTPKKCSMQFNENSAEAVKTLTCFDISPNSRLISAGTELFEGDAYILFWDLRKAGLMGGYWESHEDDLTQVKFSPNDSNKLISSSTDGLINVYDLTQDNEEDALLYSLNSESSIEKLSWLEHNRKDIVSCITHTADVQFWELDGVEPYQKFDRKKIAEGMKKKSEDYIYVVDVYSTHNSIFLLTGSNFNDGSCLRGLTVHAKGLQPFCGFNNTQRVRASYFNIHTQLLLTGGEKGAINAWNVNKAR